MMTVGRILHPSWNFQQPSRMTMQPKKAWIVYQSYLIHKSLMKILTAWRMIYVNPDESIKETSQWHIAIPNIATPCYCKTF
jgi:hypothetical protein